MGARLPCKQYVGVRVPVSPPRHERWCTTARQDDVCREAHGGDTTVTLANALYVRSLNLVHVV